MSASTKLSTSIKALSFLALEPDAVKSSAEIAGSIGVNASKLRSLLSVLAKQGIVETIKGKDGGFRLNRKCSEIDLQEIYCGIEDRKAFHLDVHTADSAENNGARKINHFFNDLFSEIQVDIENKMKQITLQTIIRKTQ